MLENLAKPEHLLLVLFIVLLLFGSKRLPELAKAVGKSVKILKTEVGDLHDDKPAGTADNATPTPSPASPSQNTDTTEHHQA